MPSGELTSKQQTSEAIRQSESILITTGQRPTVDQVAATLAMSMILRKFGKKVTTVISDSLPASVKFLDTSIIEHSLNGLRDFVIKVDVTKSEVESLRYEVAGGKLNIFLTPANGSLSGRDVSFDYGDSDLDFDLAIVIGVGGRSRIDRIYAENPNLFSNVPVANIDFRRSNEAYGAINLIEHTASSLCEIVVALSESLRSGMVDADIATVLLTGLMGATDKFTAPHTSAKSLTIAAQMMAAGGDQQKVVRGLFGGGGETRSETRGETRGGEVRGETRGGEVRGPRNDRRVEPPASLGAAEVKAEEIVKTAHLHDEPEAPRPTEIVAPATFPAPTSAPAPVMAPTPAPATEPGSVVTAEDIKPPHYEATPMADFTAAAEILRRHHANLTPAEEPPINDERPAIN